jgi:rod shape-determining protein MreD
MTRPPRGPGALVRQVQAWTGFSLLVLAHFLIRPFFTGRITVEFLLIGVLFAAARVRPGVAAGIGLVAGLLLDAQVPESFGSGAVGLTLICHGASRLRAVFFSDALAVTGGFVFLGTWLFLIGRLLVSGGLFAGGMAPALFVWAPLTAVVTAVVALLLLVLFRPLYRPAV